MDATGQFKLKGEEVHKNIDGSPRYTYPESLLIVTATQANKVEIICNIHGPFLIAPRQHLISKNGGCPACRAVGTSTSKIKASQIKWNAEILNTHIDPKGIPFYDYSDFIFTGRASPGIIICNRHGAPFKFSQAPNHHIDRKQGCPQCADALVAQSQSMPLQDFISRCDVKHYQRYDYSKVHETYVSGRSRIMLICKSCMQEFIQLAEAHLAGRGCTGCGRKRAALAKLSNTDEFIAKARLVGKNHDVCDYSGTVYSTAKQKVIIRCIPCDLRYGITPNNHLRGKGCPKCHHHTSRPARAWLSWLQETNGIQLQTADSDHGEYTIPGTKLRADGFDQMTNTIYEFHGDYWHGNPNKYVTSMVHPTIGVTMGTLYQQTVAKRELAMSLGYRYVEMWESDWLLCQASRLVDGSGDDSADDAESQ